MIKKKKKGKVSISLDLSEWTVDGEGKLCEVPLKHFYEVCFNEEDVLKALKEFSNKMKPFVKKYFEKLEKKT